MNRKMYDCEMPDCDSKVTIRSTIKTGDHKGKKVCQACKSKADGSGLSTSTKLKPFTKKNQDKRREEREGLPDFFRSAIRTAEKSPYCDNCGRVLNLTYNPHWNIAHILPKQRYKSVMTHPFNWISLCTSKEDGDCHYKFDNNINEIPQMPCFERAKKRFEVFRHEILERGKIFTIFDEN